MLERVAQYLIKHEKIDGENFYKLMANEIDTDGNPVSAGEPVSLEKPEEAAPEAQAEAKPEENAPEGQPEDNSAPSDDSRE